MGEDTKREAASGKGRVVRLRSQGDDENPVYRQARDRAAFADKLGFTIDDTPPDRGLFAEPVDVNSTGIMSLLSDEQAPGSGDAESHAARRGREGTPCAKRLRPGEKGHREPVAAGRRAELRGRRSMITRRSCGRL